MYAPNFPGYPPAITQLMECTVSVPLHPPPKVHARVKKFEQALVICLIAAVDNFKDRVWTLNELAKVTGDYSPYPRTMQALIAKGHVVRIPKPTGFAGNKYFFQLTEAGINEAKRLCQ